VPLARFVRLLPANSAYLIFDSRGVGTAWTKAEAMDHSTKDAKQAPQDDVERTADATEPAQRTWVAQGFTWLEDIVYLGLGLLLGGSALVLLVTSGISFGQSVLSGTLGDNIITLLDQILLILLIVELLYTVQVSFRDHVLVPEPFLIIVLIATTRRVLVLTAEFPKLLGQGDAAIRNAMLELGLLTLMIVALATSLLMLRKRSTQAVAERISRT
jgi:Phosphate-starvation-inducible E family